jgi:hypothetical protein
MIALRKGVNLPASKLQRFIRNPKHLTDYIGTVNDEILNITVIFDPSTDLPYIIRSYEDHPIFGLSTNDLQLSNYTSIDGVFFPQRFQTIYNTPLGSEAVLEDFLIENIEINPHFPSDYFTGVPANESSTPRAAPSKMPEYSHAEIGEGFSNMIWGPGFVLTSANVTASHPIENNPYIWNLIYEDSDYAQLVMEFEDGVIVADAPPHQSLFTIQWVKENLRKPITHLWV